MTKRVSQQEFPRPKSFCRKLSSFITARLCQKLNRSANGECQGGDSNSRPRAYESPALPLSYPGKFAAKKVNRMTCAVNASTNCALVFLLFLLLMLLIFQSGMFEQEQEHE